LSKRGRIYFPHTIEHKPPNRVTFELDALDRVIKIIDIINGETTFQYDTRSNLTFVTDQKADKPPLPTMAIIN